MTFNWKLILFAVMALLLAISIVIASHYRSVLTETQASLTKVNRELNLAKDTIKDMQTRQRDVAALDARYTKELADANATIESLRADVSAGRKRLQVAATCAKSTTGASGMGDGESPRLTADAELNYYRLRSGIDRITAQVNYLQEYIRTQCLK
ncbi:lysis protein [Cronobacter sakazakii]|uniref:Lysis protein n=2 Tax=Enterobacteriaceae TaxID=543 RepID=A0AA45C2Y6_CROSK|nr:lysis protein [Cronobacter sakazakii]PUW06883.1 lysis protein [Cronobacter sakazakii]